MSEGVLVIVRHGESVANHTATYAGWFDSDLTEKGISDAVRCAGYLKSANITFDVCFSSFLKRSIRTLWTITDELDQMWVPSHASWRLNECHCGDFTATKTAASQRKYGPNVFARWRGEYTCPPPMLDRNDIRAPMFDTRYSSVDPAELPLGESLEMAWKRLQPLWDNEIIPRVKNGEKVLIVSHGNLIRAMRIHLENLNPTVLSRMKVIPNGYPLVYRFHGEKLHSREILGDTTQRKADKEQSQVI